jgi:hypothetical protein
VNAVIEEFLRHIGTQHILTLHIREENAVGERTNREVDIGALTFDRTQSMIIVCVCLSFKRILNSSYNERTGISLLNFFLVMLLGRGLFLLPSERNASV